jgi:hypothetical protein
VGRLLAVGVAAAATLFAAGVAFAGPGTSDGWARITDSALRSSDQLGYARTPDGSLHVAWVRAEQGSEALLVRSLDLSGEPGGLRPMLSGWRSVSSPALLAAGDGLLALWAGQPDAGSEAAVWSASSGAAGETWSAAAPAAALGGPMAVGYQIGAAEAPGATPVFTWSLTFRLFSHAGLDPAVESRVWQTSCCAYRPGLGVDGRTGEVVLAWYSDAIGEHGLWSQSILPAAGERKHLPSSANDERTAAVAPEQKLGISGRIGAPGVYVAYGAGQPTWTSLLVWEHMSGRATRVWEGVVRDPSVTPGPEGRLWLSWSSSGNRVYVVRSNRSATRWGAVVRIAPPAATQRIWKLKGEGSRGPLDLLASVSTPGSLAFWHRRVLPGLTIACAGGKVVRCLVTDAGDPVRGARVRIGGRTLVTNRQGRVERDLSRGSYIVRATRTGYTGATVRVRAI